MPCHSHWSGQGHCLGWQRWQFPSCSHCHPCCPHSRAAGTRCWHCLPLHPSQAEAATAPNPNPNTDELSSPCRARPPFWSPSLSYPGTATVAAVVLPCKDDWLPPLQCVIFRSFLGCHLDLGVLGQFDCHSCGQGTPVGPQQHRLPPLQRIIFMTFGHHCFNLALRQLDCHSHGSAKKAPPSTRGC